MAATRAPLPTNVGLVKVESCCKCLVSVLGYALAMFSNTLIDKLIHVFKHTCLFQSDPAKVDMDVDIPRSDRRTRWLGAGQEERQVVLEPAWQQCLALLYSHRDWRSKGCRFKWRRSGSLGLVRAMVHTGCVTVNTTKLNHCTVHHSITADDYGMYVCQKTPNTHIPQLHRATV